MAFIQLKDVTKEFNGQVVLRGIDLEIKSNEFVTFLGPSGCGKTTTLRIIGGFIEPTGGEVLFDGEDILKLPAYKRPTNTVFQRYALFPHLNVFENVAFGLRVKHQSFQERKRIKKHNQTILNEIKELKKQNKMNPNHQLEIQIETLKSNMLNRKTFEKEIEMKVSKYLKM